MELAYWGKEITEALSYIPLICILLYFLVKKPVTKKRLVGVAISVWALITAIHIIRYYWMYTHLGFVEFPFPLLIYPIYGLAWYVIVFKPGLLK
jgi:apolipoprotein N-acyltransferase